MVRRVITHCAVYFQTRLPARVVQARCSCSLFMCGLPDALP